MFFMIFSYFWRELRRGLLELRRVLNLSSAGIDSSSAGFDSSSAGLLDYGNESMLSSSRGDCLFGAPAWEVGVDLRVPLLPPDITPSPL